MYIYIFVSYTLCLGTGDIKPLKCYNSHTDSALKFIELVYCAVTAKKYASQHMSFQKKGAH